MVSEIPSEMLYMGCQPSFSFALSIFNVLTLMSPGLEIALYRVAQEALYNCWKHAEASRVTLSVRRDGNTVCLTVSDDGRGYRPSQSNEALHLGILSMRERLRPWGGRLTISNREEGGTIVVAEVMIGGNYGREQPAAAYSSTHS